MARTRSWSWVACGIVLAFVAGFVFNTMMVPSVVAADDEVKELKARIAKLESRVDGIKLVFGEKTAGPDWGCGAEDSKETPYVVVGMKDGTGCKISNRTYYRRLELEVPR